MNKLSQSLKKEIESVIYSHGEAVDPVINTFFNLLREYTTLSNKALNKIAKDVQGLDHEADKILAKYILK